MGFLDFLIGEAPTTKIKQADTMTPEQKRAINSLIGRLSGGIGDRRYEGDLSVDPSSTSAVSLAGLEERARVLSDPQFQSDLDKQATDTLMQLLQLDNTAQIDDYFTKNVQDPLVEQFTKDILPQIGRSFGGTNFFSGERARTDDQARQDLVTQLTRSRSDLAFRSRESDRNRALQALGLTTERDATQTNELLGIFGAGQEATGLEERNIDREFQKFLAESGLDDTQIMQLITAIGIPQFENIVKQSGGSSGILPSLLSAAGAAGGFGSLFGKK